MKTTKQSIALILSVLFLCSTLISCKNSASFQQKETKPPKKYRIVRELSYTSKDLGEPDIINDSTVWYYNDIYYSYDDNDQLINIREYRPQKNGKLKLWRSDSIVYPNGDSVRIIRKDYDKNKDSLFTKKAKDYFKTEVLDNNKVRLSDDNWRLVKHSKSHYEMSYGFRGIWCCSDNYFLNDKGYIVKIMSVSDTNPSVTIYEYEPGDNPYHLYYTLKVEKPDIVLE